MDWMPSELEEWLLDNPKLWAWADEEGGALEFPFPESVPQAIVELASIGGR